MNTLSFDCEWETAGTGQVVVRLLFAGQRIHAWTLDDEQTATLLAQGFPRHWVEHFVGIRVAELLSQALFRAEQVKL
jgi:hypothetical protein